MNKIISQKFKMYTFVPPVLQEVQNVNNDLHLREDVLAFYNTKILKWITKYYKSTESKLLLDFIKSKRGIDFIMSTIISFTTKLKLKWYDLRDDKNNYILLKEYFLRKLNNKLHAN